MIEIFLDALIDSAKMLPLLLVIYIGIELLEYRYGNKIRKSVQKVGSAGPLLGAAAGSLPQCGFSVITTALYSQRLVTIGTLLAVYLATSDEAIPVILSQPNKAIILLPLIITKVIIAIFAGYSIDYLFRKKNQKTLDHIESYEKGSDDPSHHHEEIVDETACCGHHTCATTKKFRLKELFIHPIIHTLKIFSFILTASFLINLIFFKLGPEKLNKLFLGNSIFQPFLAALVGLIPNCASSVAITELYLKGAISYGSVIAGLCASGGLGLLVLFKEEKSRREVWKIIALLFSISVFAGVIIQLLGL
ncbi:MAG: putative manganese transporter [Patescibacteria group bacterium]